MYASFQPDTEKIEKQKIERKMRDAQRNARSAVEWSKTHDRDEFNLPYTGYYSSGDDDDFEDCRDTPENENTQSIDIPLNFQTIETQENQYQDMNRNIQKI